MAKKTGDRSLSTIEVTDKAMARIDEYVNRRGGRGTKKLMLSRLLEWFADQPEPVKSAIVKWVDVGMEQAYSDALMALAVELKVQSNQHVPAPATTPTHETATQGTPPKRSTQGNPAHKPVVSK